MLHEATRPAAIADAVPFLRGGVAYPREQGRQKPGWVLFHERHKDFFARDKYPHCTGFAGLPGQVRQLPPPHALVAVPPSTRSRCNDSVDLRGWLGSRSPQNQKDPRLNQKDPRSNQKDPRLNVVDR